MPLPPDLSALKLWSWNNEIGAAVAFLSAGAEIEFDGRIKEVASAFKFDGFSIVGLMKVTFFRSCFTVDGGFSGTVARDFRADLRGSC